MKSFRNIFIMLLACLSVLACKNDWDLVYIEGGGSWDSPLIDGNTGALVLVADKSATLALTVYWNDNGKISLSNPNLAAPEFAMTNTLQLSADENFSAVEEYVAGKGEYYRQFTVSELNGVVTKLGFTANVKQTLYIRLVCQIGSNIEPFVSNVLEVEVTPYALDMSLAQVLDKEKNDLGKTLYSKDSDHIYRGFLGVAGWLNWWLKEADGTIWGNLGVEGMQFHISSESSSWNMWYPGSTGCYYTIVDTPAKKWSALYIPEIAIAGDITGSMSTYDRATNKWIYTYTATEAGTISITLSGTGNQYDTSTGDSSSNDIAFGFGGTAAALTFGETATAVSIDIPGAGDVTITLDLSDPEAWTVSAAAGAAVIETVSPYLWVPGVDDGKPGGSWTYDNYLYLYDEDNKSYAGLLDVNSQWGYYFSDEENSWEGYGVADDSADPYSGTLVKSTAKNVPAPTAGIYLFDVSVKNLTYSLTAVTSVGYSGINDNWAAISPMTNVGDCIYEADVTKSADSPWGVKVYINNDWNIFFGGGEEGKLKYNANGFKDDNDLANGTYTLRVDLAKGTYSYTAK